MTWKKRYAESAARVRVPSGFLLVAVYAVFSRPAPKLLAAGALVALAGILLRACAAGHLDKNRRLTTSGPYAYTRNPLYLGSALVALGFALAGGVWWLGLLLGLFLVALYLPVVTEEEAHLAQLFPDFRNYAQAVPRFWPRRPPPQGGREMPASSRFRWPLYWQNQEYNALLGYLFGLALLVWKLHRTL